MPFLDGITLVWLVPGEVGVLELLELELELELDGDTHGGTISVVTLLLDGSTSWSWGLAPAACGAPGPPGVMRTVLGGGGAIITLLELELLELELELELLELELLEPGEPHGSIATVWVSVLLGMENRLDPGGTVLLPDTGTAVASEHEVTAMVSGLCCLGMITVRTPGLISAALTGSTLELELLPPPLLPQADSAAADPAQTTRAAIRRARIMLLIFPRSPLTGHCRSARGLGTRLTP